MLVKVYVSYKKGVLDPQGKTVHESLKSLGYNEFTEVRIGKYFEIKISDEIKDRKLIEEKVKEIADKVLSNPIMEVYSYEFVD
jgi:phosphoribosylformylglycinamidine synthase PurS subunit